MHFEHLFENWKIFGSHTGSQWWPGDPVTQPRQMTQMTHWPGDPVPTLRVRGHGHRNRDTDRSAVCDLLLTFHSNHGPIEINDDIRRKNRKYIFPSSCILRPYWTFPWELGIGTRGVKKTRIMGLPGREKSLTISSAVWIQYTNVTNRQTDTGRQQRPCLRISTRGKNDPHATYVCNELIVRFV